jgi:hypothetical protein
LKMKKALTAFVAAATIAGAMAATATDASAQYRGWGPAVGLGIIGGLALGSILAQRPRGYVVYEGYARPVRGPGCYWAAAPVYDRWGRVVGYSEDVVQVCPGYRGY